MTEFTSHLAPLILEYITYQKASGRWNDTSYGPNLLLFDRYHEAHDPEATCLSQELIDTWCVANEIPKLTIRVDPASMWWLVSSDTAGHVA
ncbi:hypothetical protein [Acidithrix sp. C25]|uniref:hypothetical protein n=1 Tax=Acidithrix sp. C25 TaxID=1671482 RepID=UPI00191B9203|nr:hypothetical protein [Acidithrix sp. C25]CAG4933515.1 unnamed protein product [Acidithrix sp. C25]